MEKKLTEQDYKELIEKVKAMNPDALLASVEAVIARNRADVACKEAKEAEKNLKKFS